MHFLYVLLRSVFSGSFQLQKPDAANRPDLLSTCQAVCSFYVACHVSLETEDVEELPELQSRPTWIVQHCLVTVLLQFFFWSILTANCVRVMLFPR